MPKKKKISYWGDLTVPAMSHWWQHGEKNFRVMTAVPAPQQANERLWLSGKRWSGQEGKLCLGCGMVGAWGKRLGLGKGEGLWGEVVGVRGREGGGETALYHHSVTVANAFKSPMSH